MKLAKNQANAKQQPETKFCYLKIIHILHAGYHPKITIHILKKKKKSSVSYSWDFAINQSKNDKRSHGYKINKPRSRHGHKFSKYKTSLSMMMIILSNN